MNNSNDASSLSFLPADGQFEASSVYIPLDQMRMIQSIKSLISEVPSVHDSDFVVALYGLPLVQSRN